MEYFRFNNTRIANAIKKNDGLPGYRLRVKVSKRGAKKPFDAIFVLTEDLNYFEMAVADTIYSLHRDNVKKFTPRKVLTILSGDEGISVSRERKKQIENCIDKLIRTEIHISCKEEKPKLPALEPRYGGAFLSAEKTAHGYEFTKDDPMPLYAYAEVKSQFITIPCSRLQYVPSYGREEEDRINNSDENILLKQYLLHELELVRNKNNIVPKKTFSFKAKSSNPILEALEIHPEAFTEDAYRNKIREVYRKAELLFAYWKRIGYLKAYEANKKEYSLHVTQEMF